MKKWEKMDIESLKILFINDLPLVILRYKISVLDLMLVFKNVNAICVEYLAWCGKQLNDPKRVHPSKDSVNDNQCTQNVLLNMNWDTV